MRIISGKHKGRKLFDFTKNKSINLRPTTDRNKEALFNILINASFINEINFDLKDCNLLDCFSGTGSVSFEALSRGVKKATLIESNKNHLELSRKNAEILGEEKNCQFLNLDLTKKLFESNCKYNLVFIDAPYEQNFSKISLKNLILANYLDKNALIIIEHSIFEEIDSKDIENIEFLAQKKYSKTKFSFYLFKH